MDNVLLQLQFHGHMYNGSPLQNSWFLGHLFWSHLVDTGARLREDGHASRGCWNSQMGDLGYERFCQHEDIEGVLHLLLDKVAKDSRPVEHGGQIIRQVSPTQSQQSNFSAEKAISTLRGLARTYLAVLKDSNTCLSTWSQIRRCCRGPSHTARVLTRYNVRRGTRMAPYVEIRGQTNGREILPLGEQVLARSQSATGLWLDRDTLNDQEWWAHQHES